MSLPRKNVFRGIQVVLALVAMIPVAVGAGPVIEHWQTENGARVYFVNAPEIPIIDVRVVFAAGSARDGAIKGLANLTNALLQEGAGELDADAFSSAMGATGAVMSNGALRDMAYADLRTLNDPQYATPALELYVSALSAPRFDNNAVDRVKARELIGFKHRQQSPAELAQKAFFESVYGDHPYGSLPQGTEASVTATTKQDIETFHQTYYVASNAVIAIVGALDRARAEAIAAQITSALPTGQRAATLPEVSPSTKQTVAVAHPSIQSHVRVGMPGVSRSDPDYFPLIVGNHALGGNALVSILFKEIRSKRGLSYSAYSYLQAMAERGPFVAALQTDRSQQEEALEVLHDTLGTFISDGPAAEDLEAAKQNLVGGFPLRVDSNDEITEYLAMIGFYDLPLDYLETFADKVDAVTGEMVKDAFARRLKPEQMVTVVVGREELPEEK